MLPLFIARRYLAATRGRLFARALTLAAVASVALGVCAMTLVVGVMTGFRTHLEQKLLGFTPHILIRQASSADVTPQLHKWLATLGDDVLLFPVVEGEVVAQPEGREGYADLGVRVRGLDVGNLRLLRGANFYFAERLLDQAALATEFHPFAYDSAASASGVVLGNEVLYALGLHPEADNRLRLTAPLGLVDPAGNLRAQQRTYQVTGFFRSGLYQQDSTLVLMGREEAVALLGAQANHAWFLYLPSLGQTDATARALRQLLGATATVQTWAELNQKLLGALQLERVVMTLLLALTIGIACMSITGIVLMQVMTRRRDLAVLAALGASRTLIRRAILTIGGGIGVLGSSVGLLVASLAALWFARHPIRLPETFYLDYLPVTIHPTHAALTFAVGVVLATGAALYPAAVAARQQVAQGLRYE